MLSSVAIRRDVIDPDLFDHQLLGPLLCECQNTHDYRFRFRAPWPLPPVLRNGQFLLARWVAGRARAATCH
jgi:hypothetical protein